MLYLGLSIGCSTIIIIVFKLFKRFEIQTFQAIVFNYVTCVVCGWIVMQEFPIQRSMLTASWFPFALTLGIIFILTFNIIAQTVAHFGITISTIMQRMSVLLSVPFAIIAYAESLPLLKVIGLVAAVLAIIFANLPDQKNVIPKALPHSWMWLYPALILLFSGFIEIILMYVERSTAGESNLQFTTLLFATAALIGTIKVGIELLLGKNKLAWKNLVAGIALGIPNFGSIYFVLLALNVGWGGSVVFPVNNVAVIMLAVTIAWLFFGEKLSKINILGVLLAILAIILIGLSE